MAPKELCVGKYKLESSDKFDEFMSEVGVNFFLRKMIMALTPIVEVTKKDENNYSFKSMSALKNTDLNFTLNKEFEETRVDGVTVKTIISRKGNKFTQIQKGAKPIEIVREFTDDHLIITCDASYWMKQNEKIFTDKVKNLKRTFGTIGVPNKAKNVIFFLGDGMGLSTITAARLYKGNVDQTDPESGFLSFEKFPSVSLAKVNSLDTTVADSAATATSYLGGVKTNQRNLGVSGNVKPFDCEASKISSNRVTSIIRWAQEAGKATGVVTTTRVTHATPAASYAHTANRKWEHNTNGTECEDIATQLVFGETGKNINVVLGGGRREFLPQMPHEQESGLRSDRINL
ncbi:alkaline phosphatase-like protein, partial [Leptotrombidium deliense]